MAVVVATGITADGSREVLGLDVGDSEDEVFWRGFLRSLRQRGLGGGVRLVISDPWRTLRATGSRAVPPSGHAAANQHRGVTRSGGGHSEVGTPQLSAGAVTPSVIDSGPSAGASRNVLTTTVSPSVAL